MSKSVLVIDTPENCYSCYLRKIIRDWPYCAVKSERIKDSMVKSDWCPLKPLPEKMTGVALTEHWGGVKKGWNGCIDAITGENVDD